MSPWPSLITALTLLVYQVLAVNVGRARAKYKVPPPQMTGDPDFERALRVQQNTLEQLVFFLPGVVVVLFLCQPIVGCWHWCGLACGSYCLCLGILSGCRKADDWFWHQFNQRYSATPLFRSLASSCP